MGSRSTDTLKEIEAIRSRVDARLEELSERLPPALKAGKVVAGIVGGGSVLAGVVKMFSGRKKTKVTKKGGTAVTVKLLPGGAIPAALAIAAVWAVVKFKEMHGGSEPSDLASVKPLKSTG